MRERLGLTWQSLVFLLVGIAIGWFIIGWWLWPVSWTSARPTDLERISRLDYLALVADSFVQNGNLGVVRQRLEGFDLTQVSRDLEDLARQSDERNLNAQAARLRNLASAINRGDLGTRPAPRPTDTPKTSATPPPAGGDALGDLLNTLSGMRWWLIFLILGLVAAALVAYAWLRWRWAQPGQGEGEDEATPSNVIPMRRPRADGVDNVPVYVTLNNSTRLIYTADSPERSEVRIIDANKSMVGQVELRPSEILRPDPNERAAALELHLFDRRERRTMIAVMVSHEASLDQEARQLISEKPSDFIRPAFDVSRLGRVVELDTRFIHLEAEVVDAVFDDGDRYPTFQYLVLEVTPMPGNPASRPRTQEEDEDEADTDTERIFGSADEADDEHSEKR